jgi:hypothetical protein
MGSFAFRRLLPVLFVLVSASLMMVAHGEKRIQEERFTAQQALLKWEQVTDSASSDSIAWDPVLIAGKLPEVGAASVALAIIAAPGVPAGVIGIGLDFPLHTDLFYWIGWCAGIAVFWYAIGNHLDHATDDSVSPLATAVRYYINALRFMSPLALVLILMSYFFDRHNSFSGNNALFVSALISWCIWGTWSLRPRTPNRLPAVVPETRTQP